MARQAKPKTPPAPAPAPKPAPAAASVIPTAPTRTVVEATPSHRGEISAMASAAAPFLYFDGAPNFGISNGIVNVTLEAVRFSAVDHEIVPDRVIVAHLRMSIPAAQALKMALEKALLLAAPVPNDQRN
jgi:hypothetical protein